MNSLVVSGSVLLVLLLLVILWRRSKRGKAEPYELQETLFSPAERAFLGVLDLAVGDQARVFAKVRVADVLTPQARLGKGKWQQAFDMISAKRFDYLLCHPTDLLLPRAPSSSMTAPIATKSARCRDLFLKSACDSAGLPLLQIPASSHYQVDELREQLLPLLVERGLPVEELLPGERREPTFNPLLLDGVDSGASHHGGRMSRSPQAEPPQPDEQEPVPMDNPFIGPDEGRRPPPLCPIAPAAPRPWWPGEARRVPMPAVCFWPAAVSPSAVTPPPRSRPSTDPRSDAGCGRRLASPAPRSTLGAWPTAAVQCDPHPARAAPSATSFDKPPEFWHFVHPITQCIAHYHKHLKNNNLASGV